MHGKSMRATSLFVAVLSVVRGGCEASMRTPARGTLAALNALRARRRLRT